MADFSSANYTHLFPTPLLGFIWPDGPELNEELRPLILRQAESTAGMSKTNVNGWHSETGQLEFCGAAGRRLVRHMYEMADEGTRRVFAETGEAMQPMRWTLRAWVNVNGTGGFNRVHTHPGSTWSGTYYVDTGDPPDEATHGTPLHFFDPCQGRANTFLQPQAASSYLLKPEPGLMVLFPSYLPHMVFPHQGSRPRISIAFNLRREPYP